MNRTGHYEYVPSKGWVKVGDIIPTLASHVWMPKGDVPYYDQSLQMRVESKAHKRKILKESGMKEGGVVRTDKRWDGHARNATKPTPAQRAERAKRQAWIQSQGGTQGLLDRLSRTRGG